MATLTCPVQGGTANFRSRISLLAFRNQAGQRSRTSTGVGRERPLLGCHAFRHACLSRWRSLPREGERYVCSLALRHVHPCHAVLVRGRRRMRAAQLGFRRCGSPF